MGQCYEYGSGTKEDIEEALRLYSAAAAQGNRDAKEAMKGLGSALVNSPATVRAANVCRSVFEKPTCLITAQEVDTLLTVDSEGNTCESGLVIDVGIKSVGHALTMATAATCFYFGYGVEEDYAFAKQLWRCADVDVLTVLSQKGEEGSAVAAAAKQYAAYLLGGMLIIGQGRAGEDEEEGAILLTRASAVCKAEGSYHPLVEQSVYASFQTFINMCVFNQISGTCTRAVQYRGLSLFWRWSGGCGHGAGSRLF